MGRDTALLVIELAALFFVVSFSVHLTQRRAGPDRLRAWMGGRHPSIVALKGVAIGFVTPFCTYSAIPLLIGFRQAGVPPAGYVAFIVAAPVLDPILFGALILIVGLDAAMLYLAVAFTAAMALALVADRSALERHLKELPVTAVARPGADRVDRVTIPGQPVPGSQVGSCVSDIGDSENQPLPWQGLRAEVPPAAGAAARLLRDLAPLLLVGIAIGTAITTFVTPDMTAAVTRSAGPLEIPISAAMGTPLYFNTELFVPIADALRSAGVGTGSIVALTIAGAGANLPEFVILARFARLRLLATFVTYVFAVAVVGGMLTATVAG
jgi:uncharacterized membrane protein YraQ (UPF0718 family)